VPQPRNPSDEDRDRDAPDRDDAALDEALEETFPASDPISPMVPDSDPARR
jgi:hypothetical protein